GEIRPFKAGVGELDLVPGLKDQWPEYRHLDALADRVGADEGGCRSGVRSIVGCLHKPACYIVERLPACRAPFEDAFQLVLVRRFLPFGAQVGRVAAYVSFTTGIVEIDLRLVQRRSEEIIRARLNRRPARGAEAYPIEPKRVPACDPVLGVQR